MRLIDRGGVIIVTLRPGVAAPEELVALGKAAKDERPADFFRWYAEQAAARDIRYPASGTPEDHVHVRRMLAEFTPEQLRGIAIDYLNFEGDRLRDGYHHHMRLLYAQRHERAKEREDTWQTPS